LGTPPQFRSYQTLGDIYLSFDSLSPVTEYTRELHLNSGIASTVFTSGGITYTREVFSSAPDNIITIHLSADIPGTINTTLSIQRQQDASVKANKNQLILIGQIVDKTTDTQGSGGEHMRFAAKLLAINEGGELITDSSNTTG